MSGFEGSQGSTIQFLKSMKTKPTTFLAALLGILLTGGASAEKPPKPPSPEERLEKMKTDLALSDAQVGKIRPILEANMAAMKAVHEDASLSEEQKKEKGRETRRAGGEAIMAELTANQKNKFEEEMKKHRKDGPHAGPEGPVENGQRKGPGPDGQRPKGPKPGSGTE